MSSKTLNMKIYFVASVAGKTKMLNEYQNIVHCLEELGHNVQQNTLEASVDEIQGLSDVDKSNFYKKTVAQIQASDLVVAEASYASVGVGHEITLALEKSKPVVVLHNGTGSTHLLEGMQSDKMVVMSYEATTLKSILAEAIDFAKDQVDTRFNFFIAPRHANYLDWISKQNKMPRSAYLRTLIKQDLQNNPDYNKA